MELFVFVLFHNYYLTKCEISFHSLKSDLKSNNFECVHLRFFGYDMYIHHSRCTVLSVSEYTHFHLVYCATSTMDSTL